MSNILEKIIANKRTEVARRKELYPTKLLETTIWFASPTVSLRKYLTRPDRAGIIAEIKRQSPSRGMINKHISVEQLSIGYMMAGASALSILTDKTFFGGSNEDLTTARKFNYCPILRKDFVVDEYQIIEARSIGADAVLLLANVLNPLEIKQLAALARSLDLEVLLEIHDENELAAICPDVSCVGVNNRDLRSFEVSVENSLRLAAKIPGEFVKVSESGLTSAETILTLREAGFQGFLIGEFFMKNSAPEEACKELIEEIQKLQLVENQ